MSASHGQLSELATLLREAPSDVVFRAICSLIDTWPADGSVREAVQTAQEGLEAWPDSLRHVDWEHDLEQQLRPCMAAPSWPLVRSLESTQSPPEVVKVLDFPHSLIRRIRVFPVDDAALQEFAGCDSLPHLSAIDLQGYDISPDTLRGFLFDRLPESLATLSLAGIHGEDVWSAVSEFLNSEKAARLERLTLWHYPDSLIQSLMGSPPGAPTLLELPRVSDLDALRESPQFASRLGSLYLGSKSLGDEGVIKLASCRHLHNLERLELRFNQIGPAGMAALAKAPFLSRN